MASAQPSTPSFNLAQRVGQQANSSVGGPSITSMMADNWGNVYVAGYFSGTVQLGATQLTTGNVPLWATRSFLAKLDATGTYQWALDFDGYAQPNENRLLAVDAAGNAYLAGMYTGPSATFGPFQLACPAGANSLYVLKVAPNGTYLWARQAGLSTDVTVQGLAVDQAGGVYVSGGYTSSSTTFGSITLQNATPGHSAAFVAKMAASGTWQWATQTVASSYSYEPESIRSLAIDALGSVYVAGSFGAATVSLGTTILTNNTPYGFTGDAFVAKLDTAGQWVWGHRVGGPSYDHAFDVAVDVNGDVVFLGYIQGQVDAASWVQPPNSSGSSELFVARLTAAGLPRWVTSAGGSNVEVPTQLALDAAGNAYVAGRFNSAIAAFGTATVTNAHAQTGYEAFVAKIDPAGTWQWAQQTQCTYETTARGLGVDPSGTVWLFGSCQGNNTQFSSLSLALPTGFVARLGSEIYPTLVGGVVPASGRAGQVVTVTGARFTGVTGVLFNNIPASSFTVLSSTKLLATVPPGATTGGVEVRTAAGGNGPAPVFQVAAPLAAGAAQALAGQVWPVPVATERVLHLRLPYNLVPGRPGWASLRSALGAEVRAFPLTSSESALALLGVSAGLYVLTVHTPGQLPLTYRVALE